MYRVLKSHSIKILKDILNIQISPSPLPSPLSSLPSAEPTPTSLLSGSVQHGKKFLSTVPKRLFGQVEVNLYVIRQWVCGEVMQALAYDVLILGYQTKNTISLRLWEPKAYADDFDLSTFNGGQLEPASVLHSRAKHICSFLYPGDATKCGILLRPKQHYFLYSASLHVWFLHKSTLTCC
ncbi:alpha-glucan phosphorylase, H isozyme isoform X2 [Lathyrus oleraceus]|uniref:alpha-glucan phosphorylase, H isozyme isoform X2 n=1 Tax=Pisum sativum TaxID=3888 RepID=UPI0021D1546F|nr:alpha-glucan phosphorylase, H isozyme-like isoform X2 [Pisum sativum]XP_050905315.1 alpha-glucan phosphorylase, H isozyme-like isoform X2 [Pisum sativum]XP_050905316.1 alpha-glucan phosphorylase, H isozyme-like isoform X2 [Pisum sativum]